MMRRLSSPFWFVSLLFLLFNSELIAQINVNVTEGCAPLSGVQFTTSYPNPVDVVWDFGNGSSSNLLNPEAAYALPGTYTVTFTATVSGNEVSDQLTITVFEPPTPNFSVNPEAVCLGTPMNFTDQSSGGSGTDIVMWEWDYGNGTTGEFGANPTFTYPNSGSYQVSLTVVDENNCESTASIPGAAVVSTSPNVNVSTTPNPPAACEAPLTVGFNNNSTSNSPSGNELTYSWTFGEGSSSTSENPPDVTYTMDGFYTVTVTATDNVGCSATQNINVSVQQPTADISVVGGEDGVVCSDVEFVVEGTTGGVINYGNGNLGTSLTEQYTSAGEYTATYSVNVSGCPAEANVTFNVEIPQAEIISSPGFSCENPAEFSFELSSESNLTQFEWFLPGETDPNTEENPSITVDYEISENEFAVNGLQTFTTSVFFVSDNGCQGSAFAFDSLALPNALFYPSITQGCAPLSVEFFNESTYVFPEEVESVEWNFGDNTTEETGFEEDAEYTYTEAGDFEAFLVVTTIDGCVDTSFVHTIEVGEPVNPSFSVNPAIVCPGDPVTVTNTSTEVDLIDGYSYSADFNTVSTCADEDSPIFTFDEFAGNAIITQYVEYNGCLDSSSVTIQVDGPVGNIRYGCNCETPFDYTFTGEVFEAESWNWDFGDGTIIENSTDLMVSHTYSETGDFTATLTTINENTDCGVHISSVLVKVRNLAAEIEIEPIFCAGTNQTLTGINLQDVAESNGGCFRNYLWDFGDNTLPVKTTGPTTNHIFQEGGEFVVSLSVKDDNECVVTTTSTVDVFSIEANYEADTLFGCLPLEVNFSDLSVSDTTITEWEWSFGINDEGSVDQDPSFIFDQVNFDGNNNPIPYNITLVVTNELGCTDNVSGLVIQPLAPNPEFDNTTSTQICVGENVLFAPDANISTNTYNWDYGNGTVSEGAIGNGVFEESGTYTVSLLVTDEFGCFREDSVVSFVQVQDFPSPIIGTNFEEGEILCYPFIASYADSSINEFPGGLVWNVEQLGTISNQSSVGTTYLSPGFYDVTLTVESTFGCEADTTIEVEVQGPLAVIELSPFAICPGGEIELTLSDTVDLAFWDFNFGDGNNSEINQLITTHNYDNTFLPANDSTIITLNMFSADSACNAARTVDLVIEDVIADFNRNNESSILDSIHCFGTPDFFSSTSSANATQFFWSVDDIPISSTQDFNTLLDPGEYVIKLIVNSNLGCLDSIAKNMEIFPLPEPTASGGTICQGETIELVATGGTSYSWSPQTGLDDPNAEIVQATPEVSTTYTVTATDDNDCSAAVSSFVLVYQPPPTISVDTTIIIGDTAITGFNLGSAYTYQWTPNIEIGCDTCPITSFRPLDDQLYTLAISDTLGCFTENSFFFFEIREVASVVVPDAFSPNGDGINDVVFVEGWGIEELISFQIYNRCGELIFETTDENEGWDGTYKGEIQNPDSYAYVIKAKNFIRGNPETFKGFIDLIR
ncbi:MAG: PKD domain-containing protein [Bacteroidota bacterium]